MRMNIQGSISTVGDKEQADLFWVEWLDTIAIIAAT